jgi:hypothetical protein
VSSPRSARLQDQRPTERFRDTYRYEEEYTSNHRSECCPTRPSRIDISQKADDQSPSCRRERSLVRQEPIRGLIRRVRAAREDYHDGQSSAPERLQIRERGAGGIEGHQEEHCPPRERLAKPRPLRVAVTPCGWNEFSKGVGMRHGNVSREKRNPTSRDVTVRSVDEAEGPRETQLGRGV